MKKLILPILAAMLLMTSCNMSLGPGSYNFKRVHVDGAHISQCITVEKWYDCDSGIEVKTKEAGAIFLSEGTYILVEETCPFCRAIN
ncbi:MAG: hypothetical protein J6S14_15135 [Clostridia bacterium]|nr:hypothetical protein [Clostridia bacterium]